MTKVLVADDSKFFRMTVCKALEAKGFETIQAKDGQEALDILLIRPEIQLGLIDWHMPHIDGPDLCVGLRTLRPDVYRYLILLTSQSSVENIIEGMDSGADDYVTKSQSIEELLARLNAGVRIIELHNTLKEEENRLKAANDALIRTTKSLKDKEEELENELALRQQVLGAIPSFCISLDVDLKINTWNIATERLFGITSEAALGKNLVDLDITWDKDQIAGALKESRETLDTIYLEALRIRVGDDIEKEVDISFNTILTEVNEHSGYLLTGKDITSRVKLERELAQRSRLESIGNLAAGVAHEINTPIQYVRDNTIFLQTELKNFSKLLKQYDSFSEHLTEEMRQAIQDMKQTIDYELLLEEIPEALGQTLEGVDSVANIVRSMKEFAHPSTEDKELADVNSLISNISTVARNEWKYVADLEFELMEGLPYVPCFRAEVNQVILNLIVNAAHAIEESERDWGKITLKTEMSMQGVKISITDTGSGISPEIRKKVFDPFFTTKEVGKGTGQGLSLAYSTIVDKHGGELDFESEVGEGTTFWFVLPLENVQEEQGLSISS